MPSSLGYRMLLRQTSFAVAHCFELLTYPNFARLNRGVVWDPDTQYWAVRLATRGGERRQFGMFDTEIEAAIAYDAAVLELFGSRTPTNFDSEYGAHTLFQGRHVLALCCDAFHHAASA